MPGASYSRYADRMQRAVERILNLLAFLLTVNRAVTADEIRHTVAGYDQETDVAFRRTFERDKDLLRSLGVPLRLVFTDRWEVEQGYVVHPDEYALTDPGLTDEERAALWLASRMANLGGESTSAIFKLGGAPAAASGDPLGLISVPMPPLSGPLLRRRRSAQDHLSLPRRTAVRSAARTRTPDGPLVSGGKHRLRREDLPRRSRY